MEGCCVIIYGMMDSLASQFLRCAVKVWWKAAITSEVSEWHPSISPFPTLRVVHGWGVAPPPAVHLSVSQGRYLRQMTNPLSHSHLYIALSSSLHMVMNE